MKKEVEDREPEEVDFLYRQLQNIKFLREKKSLTKQDVMELA